MVTVGSNSREYDGLSTDTKPTGGARNGEIFIEIDTGKIYLFDEEGQKWYEQEASSTDPDETNPDNKEETEG